MKSPLTINMGDPGALLGKNLLDKLPTWVRLPGNGYPLQYSCLENSTDRGACRVTVHGVTNSLARLCTQHTVSFDIIGNLLCQMQCPYIIILSHQEKPYSKEIRPRVSRRRKHGVRGLGTTDRKLASREPVWGGGVNLGGRASAFICITNTHRTQYVQFIIRIYRNFLQT